MTSLEDSARMLSSLLRASHLATFEDLPFLLDHHASEIGLHDVRVYLTDLQQQVLREVTGHGLDAGQGGQELRIDATLAGRVFRSAQPLSVPTDGRMKHWLPLLDGTERLGVLRLDTEREPDERTRQVMDDLASLTGLLMVAKRLQSDSYARLVRTSPMSITAEMQWTLMPPRTFSNRSATISAVMEPAYNTAGDAFDYAVAGDTVHMAVFDAMGHDTAAGLSAHLAIATCRNQRRQGRSLLEINAAIETTLIEQFAETSYVTALLADLDLRTGWLSWIRCGHHPPVLIRGGRWTTELSCTPTHPLGTDLGLPVTLCREQLQPGDRLLLYTDGVIEARDAEGHEFGLDHFVDFIIRHQADGLAAPETLRRLINAVLGHHGGNLTDDATVLLCEWHGDNQAAWPIQPLDTVEQDIAGHP